MKSAREVSCGFLGCNPAAVGGHWDQPSCDGLTTAIEARDAEHLANYFTPEEKVAIAGYHAHLERLAAKHATERDRLAEAVRVATSTLRSLAGEHGNRGGIDWCRGPCAHPDCIAHLALEALARLDAPVTKDG